MRSHPFWEIEVQLLFRRNNTISLQLLNNICKVFYFAISQFCRLSFLMTWFLRNFIVRRMPVLRVFNKFNFIMKTWPALWTDEFKYRIVTPHMFAKRHFMHICILAYRAYEVAFPCVTTHMLLQLWLYAKAFRTNIAFEFFRVKSCRVLCYSSTGVKSGFTQVTGKRLSYPMYIFQMYHFAVMLFESFVALRAFLWFHSRFAFMDDFCVIFQLTLLCEH